MKRELRDQNGHLLGYEVTPGDDNTGPCTEPPRYQEIRGCPGPDEWVGRRRVRLWNDVWECISDWRVDR